MKVVRWLLSTGLILGLLLAGCGPGASVEPAKTAPQPAGDRPTAATAQTREQQLIEAAKKEGGEVSLWVHSIAEQETIIRVFQAKYPFLKLQIWNSQGAQILSKLSEEAKAGRHSVDVLILSSEIANAHSSGLLTEYEFPNVVGWTNQPKHNFYKAYAGTARVVVYNTDLVPPADVPRSMDDLKSTKWAGRAFVSTSAEDAPFFWAYLFRDGDKLNWDKSFAFWTDVIKNSKARVVSGFTGSLERLAAGEAAIFPPVSTSGTFRLMSKGAPIAIAPLGVATGDVAGIALIKDAPHPNSARLLIDWLTSDEGLLTYTNPTMWLVLNPQLVAKSRGNGLFKSLGITMDPVPNELVTTENLKKSSDFWMKALGMR